MDLLKPKHYTCPKKKEQFADFVIEGANSRYKDQNTHINQNFAFRLIFTLMQTKSAQLKKK